ncbi:xanthine dehydrogenase family protein molybdopterin-binding subunit [Serinicoccus sp. LYQ131]|uniref:xanthine dehydrogenase family protein molybdopterin-binding subunit n=1 Tax=Serinicoccus sp. LYQ131 TaxID=3378797 RepID=UPI00385320E1
MSTPADRARVDGPAKVAGLAPYAYEHPVPDPLYLFPVLAGIARGEITDLDTTAAEAVDGVELVLTHRTAPRLRVRLVPTLSILQSTTVRYRGEIVGAVVARTPEAARHAASLVRVEYAEHPHLAGLDEDHPAIRTPLQVMGARGRQSHGDVDAALREAAYRVQESYRTPQNVHNPIEPHAVTARWEGRSRGSAGGTRVTLWESNQGPLPSQSLVAGAFGLLPGQVEVVAPYVGGSFGTKGMPHPHVILTVMAARALPGRSVKTTLTRPQMFAGTGYRPASTQRVALAADAQGRLTGIEHDTLAPVSRVLAWADPTLNVTRMMYAAPARRTAYRQLQLDVAPGSFMRAPGEYTGMFALETAMDELAHTAGIDPIELRRRNEPGTDPESGKEWSSRHLMACLDEGRRVFGFTPSARTRTEGAWRLGMGVAAATFPMQYFAPSLARITFTGGGYVVSLQASDIGTGAWTVLPQIAAQALGVPVEQVRADIGASARPAAMIAGGSSGTYTWGGAIIEAARAFRARHGARPVEGATVRARGRMPAGMRKRSRHAFGAHFAEVAVDDLSGEVRVRRLYGHYDAGRIINPRTARSQFVGGMTMGLSGALHEEAYRDPRFGHVVTQDLASYHIAAHADVLEVGAGWVDEPDPWFGPTGAKGIGEIGIVGVAAAIGNAIFDATGTRLRELPFTPARVLEALDG